MEINPSTPFCPCDVDQLVTAIIKHLFSRRFVPGKLALSLSAWPRPSVCLLLSGYASPSNSLNGLLVPLGPSLGHCRYVVVYGISQPGALGVTPMSWPPPSGLPLCPSLVQ